MRSVRPRIRTAATGGTALALAAAGLAGCATTQQTAARLQLNSARQRAIENPTRVAVANPDVTVRGLARVTAGGPLATGSGGGGAGASGSRSGAWVVSVHNGARHAVSDLPISVGYRLAGRRPVYLNASTSLGYFANHLPGIAAGATVRWVFTGSTHVPAGARPFAMVGAKPAPAVGQIARLPALSAKVKSGPGAQRATVTLTNDSSVPQLQMQLYAYAQHGGRYVAAGSATVPNVGTGATTYEVHMRLLGDPGRVPLTVEALPAIFK